MDLLAVSLESYIFYFFGFFFPQPHVPHMTITFLLIRSIPYKSCNGKGSGSLPVIRYLHTIHYMAAGSVIMIIYSNIAADVHIR